MSGGGQFVVIMSGGSQFSVAPEIAEVAASPLAAWQQEAEVAAASPLGMVQEVLKVGKGPDHQFPQAHPRTAYRTGLVLHEILPILLDHSGTDQTVNLFRQQRQECPDQT